LWKLIARPGFSDAIILATGAVFLATLNSIQGWEARNKKRGKGTFPKFMTVYYRPSLDLILPYFAIGKLIGYLNEPQAGVKLISLAPALW